MLQSICFSAGTADSACRYQTGEYSATSMCRRRRRRCKRINLGNKPK